MCRRQVADMSQSRRLAAILAADVVGYSRLMGADEEGTLERLKRLRQEVIDPNIAKHHGRIVKTTGDGMLVEFASVVDAVRCAAELQQAMSERNAGAAVDRRIELRIGINLGDVIADGDDLFGDGVNIAARIEALAEPGGVYISGTAYEQVRDRLSFAFEDRGEQQVKNIARPIRVYRVLFDEAAPTATNEALPLPDKPSIAVLAFTNMSGNPAQEYFSDGVADDIITELSRDRSLFVIARNSSFTYKSRAVDIKQVGHELGVRYVLEGSVQRSGDRVRVNVQLIDAKAGSHVWADRYNRHLADVFTVQDEITDAVARAIGPAISQTERERAARKPPDNLDAWEAYQRGLWHLAKGGAADVEQSRMFFRRAIELDELFAAPRGMLAFTSALTSVVGRHPGAFTRHVQEAEAEARKAIALDPEDAGAIGALSWSLKGQGQSEAALEQAEHAILVNPNHIGGYLAKGHTLALSGRAVEAQQPLLTALRLSPRDALSVHVLRILMVAHYFSGEYAEAASVARRAIRDYPGSGGLYRWFAAALGQLGRADEARHALQQAIAHPTFEFFVRSRPPFFRPEDHEHLFDGLRKAGWQG
jgi:adenylate cyclase